MNAESWNLLLRIGLITTVALSIAAGLISLVLGTFIGIFRVSPVGPLRVLANGYVEFFRNIPLLICLAFIFYGLPKAGITFPIFEAGVIGLSVYTPPSLPKWCGRAWNRSVTARSRPAVRWGCHTSRC